MFPIFDGDNNRVLLFWDTTYEMNNPAGGARDSIEVDGFSVRDVFSAKVEPYTQRNGFEAYRVHHNSKIIRIAGVIRKPTVTAALEAFNTMAGSFDPNYLFEDDRDSAGFRALEWTQDGNSHLYEARPLQTPDLMHNIYQGPNIPFNIDLLAKPIRKMNPVSASTSNAGIITNTGDTIGYPIITRTLSGAGPASWVLDNDRAPTVGSGITLNLSSLSSGTITVDMEKREVSHNGSPIDHLLLNSEWWGLYPGNNTITITGGTLTSATFNRFEAYWSK